MKIMKLTSYFFPEQISSSSFEFDLYNEFAKNNFRMDVFTPTPTRGIDDNILKKYKKIRQEYYINKNIIIHRFPMFMEGKNTIQRAFRYILCNFFHFIYGIREKDTDIIFCGSTPPTQGVVCVLVKKVLSWKYNKKIQFIFNLQDIFPDSLVTTKITNYNSFIWKIGRIIESYTYKNADIIVVISEDFKKNIMGKGVPEEKIVVIPNWVNTEDVKPISKSNNNLFDELNISKNKFNIVYAGNLGKAQGLKVIIDSAHILNKQKNIQFIVIGSGIEEEYLKKMSNGLNNISFFPMQPHERISEVYSLGDANIVSCAKGTGSSAMPSKTWSMMSCERPVLACFDSGTSMQNTIEGNKCGLFSEAEDGLSLSKNILHLYNNPELCIMFSKNARNFVVKNLSKDKLTEQYIKIFIELYEKSNSLTEG